MGNNCLKLLASALFCLIAACGGSGSGSTKTTADNPVVYSGATERAKISQANAEQFVEKIMSGGVDFSEEVGANGADSTSPSSLSDYLSELLDTKIASAVIDAIIGVVTGTNNIDCPEGGTVSIDVDSNVLTGRFTADLNFTNCSNVTFTGNGEVEASGTYSVSALKVNSPITLKPSNFKIVSALGADIAVNGRVDNDFSKLSSGSLSATENIDLRNNAINKTFKKEDFQISVMTVTGGAEISLFGKFYHPDFGFVEVVTDSNVFLASSGGWPSSGVVRLLGAGGSSTKVTILDSTQYMLEIDADGDASFETNVLENWPS